MSEPRVVEIPVAEVTVMEDRARVVRRARLALPAGASRLVVEGVAPVLVDKTLSATVEGAELRDLHAARRARLTAEDREVTLAALDEEIETTEDAVARMECRLERAENALGLLEEAGERTIEEIEQDAAWSHPDPDGWKLRLEALASRQRDLREERLGARRELAERHRELARLRRRRAAAETPSSELAASVHLEVALEAEATVEIAIEYVVPNACWRPAHRATLRSSDAAGSVVRFESEGCVWQNTGEDWNDAILRFSTQRPSLGAEPPALTSDVLRVQRKSEAIHVERRERAVETAGLGGGDVTPRMPGIDDGGDVLELRAPHPATVPSDGAPHRVGLFELESEAEGTLYCVPELVASVLAKTTQANTAAHPLLAGPVDLVRGGGFVGRTSILYVSPGERFELGWGPDPELRVHREVEELEPETSLMRNWHTATFRVVDKLSNLARTEKRLELIERVPVSELEKVKIEVDLEHTTERASPNEDGFVRWTVVLGPLAREARELRYAVKKHSDVVGL